jgi:hypothetical protein
MRLPDLEPGTWADWTNAIATTLGFTVALVLFMIGLRDRRRADEDRRRAELDRRSQQARKVWVWRTGWTDTGWTETPLSGGASMRSLLQKVGWKIENTSDDPITNCIILLHDPRDGKSRVMGMGAEVLRAGDTAQGDVKCSLEIERSLDVFDPIPRVHLLFTDAGGQRWERFSDGELREAWI